MFVRKVLYRRRPKIVAASGGPVLFDALSSSSVAANAGTTLSWTHTPVGTPTSVGVFLLSYDGLPATITGVTYGGSALTKYNGATSGSQGGFSNHTEIWGSDGLTLPSGAQTVVITANVTGNYINGAAVTVTGSNRTTCFSNVATSNDFSSTAVTTNCTSATGELVVDVVGLSSAPGITVGAGQTDRLNQNGVGIFNISVSTEAGAASTTMSWTLGGAQSWTQSVASFKSA